ncbi:RNA-binding cell elongation regulator Jag/EloR [Bacillota bacterium LX-D]|nr:RNA-binding cell elongation regulator Jag/EloR [Bacillota bacterium LX-D]
MRSVEITAKTVEEAVETALKELKVKQEDVKVEVLEEPSKGLFGIIGCRMAKVRITMEDKPSQVALDFLNKVFAEMDLEVNVEIKETNDTLAITFSGPQLGILIGRRGETLDALQYLTNLAVNHKFERRIHVLLDVEGYRKRREQTLINLAQRLSEKVKRTGKNVVLEPMNSHERRIIHTTLQNDNYVQTYSEGQEPYRKVVISLKNKVSQESI